MVFFNRNLRQVFFGLSAILFLVSCGSRGEITGGPIDDLIPRVVSSDPSEFRSIKGRNIKIIFNKPIDENKVDNYIRFYPRVGFSTYVTDKTLNISIKSDLYLGKNYYLMLEKGLKCYHDIAMEESKILVFCNDYLSTNEISGEFVFEKEKDKQDTVLLQVYDQDTVFIFEQKSSLGYQLKYLSQGQYLVKAFIDKNKNGSLDEASEPFWEKRLTVSNKYLVEPIVLGYVDSISPLIKNVLPLSDRRMTVDFDEDLVKLKKYSISSITDTLAEVNVDGDTVYTVRNSEKIDVRKSLLVDGKLHLLTSPMNNMRYMLVAYDLVDWKGNITKVDTVFFQGKADTLATEIKLVSSDPVANSGVLTLLPRFLLKFDRLLFDENIDVSLLEKETGKRIALTSDGGNGFEFSYLPKSKLTNFTSYLLIVNASDDEGNSLPQTEIEFIITYRTDGE